MQRIGKIRFATLTLLVVFFFGATFRVQTRTMIKTSYSASYPENAVSATIYFQVAHLSGKHLLARKYSPIYWSEYQIDRATLEAKGFSWPIRDLSDIPLEDSTKLPGGFSASTILSVLLVQMLLFAFPALLLTFCPSRKVDPVEGE